MFPFSIIIDLVNLLFSALLAAFNLRFLLRLFYKKTPKKKVKNFYWLVVTNFVSYFGWFFMPRILSRSKGELISDGKKGEWDSNGIFFQKYLIKDKPVLVFVNGWGSTNMVWYYFRKEFENRFQLIFWDEPGIGKSKLPRSNNYSLDKYASDLYEIIQGIKSDKIILIGHSIGGMIVQQLFKNYMDKMNRRISGVVLLNTTYINPSNTTIASSIMRLLQNILFKPMLFIQVITWPLWQIKNLFSYLNGSLHLSAFLSGFSGVQTRNELNLATSFMLKSRVDVLNKGAFAMATFDCSKILDQIKVRTLVIGGSRDILTVPEASKYIASKIPLSSLKIVKGAKHMGNLEYHQEYLKTINSWFVDNLKINY